ncbi:glycosyltransferase family 2 protein [Cohnella sp. GCM10027633]|uniref:glycosyltransferase family 2 protein n=1 Tax=unclassified Cohnella TaxID=2636738 RepID=UPI0036256A0A
MRYSVIIPTYNRSVQALLTLTAFEMQSFPMDAFEVVVVNDGSTDDTLEQLLQCRKPYRLVIVSLHGTQGRSAARNAGVAAAQGDNLIFCDPDYLVTPRFLKVHADYLARFPNTVISGVPHMWKNIYAQYFPDFSEEERGAVSDVMRHNGLWSEAIQEQGRIVEIVTQDDVRRQSDTIARMIRPQEASAEVLHQYTTTDVAPWLLCVTRSMSMTREMFARAGGFHEPFKMYGFEDWELGYRLHRMGCPYVCIDEEIGYHQQHPSAFRNTDVNGDNLRMGFRMHGVDDPELSMFAVCSPAEDIFVYKNSLRLLHALRGSTSAAGRALAARLTADIARVARLFVDSPQSPAYLEAKNALKQELTRLTTGAAPPPQEAPTAAKPKRRRRRRRLRRGLKRRSRRGLKTAAGRRRRGRIARRQSGLGARFR